MTTDEFAVIAAALRTYYPKHNMFPNGEAISLWYDSLKDIPAEVLSAALKAWVVTEKWPPTIAELRERSGALVNGEKPDWGEGWCEVQKAVRMYGWCRPQEALASMTPITREAVRRMGWQAICESENPDTVRAQFRQVYLICEKRDATESNMTPELRDVIRRLRLENLGTGLLEDGR